MFTSIGIMLMEMDTKLDRILTPWRTTMGGKRKRKPIDPETRARWVAARRQLQEAITRAEERVARRKAAAQRRQARLRRWSFGMLGRG